MVGSSPNWNRPSYFAMKYLQQKGYRVIPVNPKEAGNEILGETVYASLSEIPVKVDMVDFLPPSVAIPPIAGDAPRIGTKVLGMQPDVRHAKAPATPQAPAPAWEQQSHSLRSSIQVDNAV